MRLSATIRTDVRIYSFFLHVVLVRSMRRRLAKTAVRAFVLPGINGQTVSLETVVRTREIVSVTLGAVANSLAFVGHVFRSKRGSHHDRSWRPWRSNAAKGYLDRYDAENRPPQYRTPRQA